MEKRKIILTLLLASITWLCYPTATAAQNARKFLLDGDKVKITVRFRGREMELGHLGQKILDNFANKLEDVSVIEKPAKREGRNITVVLGPKKA